jgi:hypothetical protein
MTILPELQPQADPEPTPPSSESASDQAPPLASINIEDLTVAQLIGQFFRTPIQTWTAFAQVAQTPVSAGGGRLGAYFPMPTRQPQGAAEIPIPAEAPLSQTDKQRLALQLGLRVTAFLLALYGSAILARERAEMFGLDVGAPFLIAGFGLWLLAEVYGSWPNLRAWWVKRQLKVTDETIVRPDAQYEGDVHTSLRPLWLQIGFGGLGVIASNMAYNLTQNNKFTPEGILAWIASILLWVLALGPANWGPAVVGRGLAGLRQWRLPRHWTLWMLLVIVLLAGYFRLRDLPQVPPEMTSDHVEKLLDAQRIVDGNPQIFFPNNGGRDAIQFYILSALIRLPGLGTNFMTLKLLTVLEGLLTIPLLYWMGRELIGRENRQLGQIAGLILAALVAVSYWHTVLSRLGLRIVLTPLLVALILIVFSRALRDNRRADFIKTGLLLGLGLYAYQAMRIVPVVVALGGLLAIVFAARTWRARWDYVGNMLALVIVGFVVFVPLFGVSVQYPDHFWMRTSGRLLGDEIIQTKDEQGRLIERRATLEERFAAFQNNLPVLMNNIRNALLMFNWKGDVAWINAAPNRPQLDILTGTLFIVGLAAWLARMFRRRDAVDWLLPMMLFIMLLPSAFSIAYPVENPSATRTSGAIPVAYLFAAFALGLVVYALKQLIPKSGGLVIGAGASAVIIFGAFYANTNTYFNDYRQYYSLSSLPYSVPGKMLHDFGQVNGFGNAFMLASRYWWDHRAVGIQANLIDWPNGVIDPDGDEEPLTSADELPKLMYKASQRSNVYRFDPEKEILIFYAPTNEAIQARLQTLFPTGVWELIQTYQPEDTYKVYHVPRLGLQGFVDLVVRTGAANP